MSLAIAAAWSAALAGTAEGKGFPKNRWGGSRKSRKSRQPPSWQKAAPKSQPASKGQARFSDISKDRSKMAEAARKAAEASRTAEGAGRSSEGAQEASGATQQTPTEPRDDSRSHRRRRVRRKYDKSFPLKAALTFLADIIGLCGGGALWCVYLENNPKSEDLRFYFCAATVMVSAVDVGLYFWQVAWLWFVPAVLFVNFWGTLDASLRFPALHGLDSLFTLKQLFLLAAKVVVYSVGFKDLSESVLIYLTLIIINIIGLPLLYLVALPQEASASDVPDVDIAVKCWRILTSRDKRLHMSMVCARRTHTLIVWILQCLPAPLQNSLASISPWYRRALQEGKGRRV